MNHQSLFKLPSRRPSPLTLCALAATTLMGVHPVLAEQKGTQHKLLVANTGRVAILAKDGTLERDIKSGGLHEASLLPNGNLRYQSSWTKVTELNSEGKVVWEYDSATSNGNAGVPLEVHACQRLQNGLTMIAESGVGRIIEVDREGKLQHEIKLVRDHVSKHSDTRLVRSTPAGTYLVAHEADGKVREYNREGKVVWEFEEPLFGKKPAGGHGPEAFGNHLFSVVRIPNATPSLELETDTVSWRSIPREKSSGKSNRTTFPALGSPGSPESSASPTATRALATATRVLTCR